MFPSSGRITIKMDLGIQGKLDLTGKGRIGFVVSAAQRSAAPLYTDMNSWY